MGIKLDDDDVCLGGVLVGGRFDKLVRRDRERQDAGVRPRRDQGQNRGGKGDEAGERTKFARVVPPPIELVNWDEVEGKAKPASDERRRERATTDAVRLSRRTRRRPASATSSQTRDTIEDSTSHEHRDRPHEARRTRTERHPGPRRPGAGPQAAVDVHRRRRRQGAAPPRLGNRRQRRRRVPQRLRRPHHRHAAQGAATPSPSPTTAAASPSTCTRSTRSPASNWSSRAARRRQVRRQDSGYIHSGGLHGVGASVVNALSKKLVATVRATATSGSRRTPRASRTAKLEKVGPFRGHGTSIYFEPDDDDLQDDALRRRHDQGPPGGHVVHPQRAEDHLQERDDRRDARPRQPRRHPGVPRASSSTDGQKPAVTEAAFTRGTRQRRARSRSPCSGPNRPTRRIRSYVNGIRTPPAARTRTASRAASSRPISNYIETHDIKIKGLKITADDIREGVVGVLSVFVREPQFQGQTKERLNNPEMDADGR